MAGDDGDNCGRDALELAIAALAAWRVTHLLAYEDGPADVVANLRVRLGDGFTGRLVDCFDCLGIWVAAALVPTLSARRRRPVVRWLALSGAAGLLERAVGGEPPVTIEPLE